MLKMRISNRLSVRKVGNEYIGIKVVESDNIDVTNAIGMNETSYFIVQNFIDKDFTEEDVVSFLLDNYDVSLDLAKKDVSNLISKLKSIDLIEI